MSYARKFIFKALTLLLAVGFISLNAYPVRGQEGIALKNPGATVDFGKSITFHAKVTAPLPIKQISLLFRAINEDVTHVENVQAAEDGSVNFKYDASLSTFPPFGEILFWFQATLSDNKTYTSEAVKFPYNDTRFPWREMTRANVTVYWYAGDDAFGAAALDMAAAGMLAMREFIPISLTDPIHIYIYSNAADLQNTLMLGGTDWAGGHAAPQIGVVLVSIAPDAPKSELETKIPHELTHVMLYRSLGVNYARQPAWLLEGIASTMEVYANAEYKRALDVASKNDSLIPFEDLCVSFPPDSGSAYLAYAQSQSFVKYIYESYGASGLSRLNSAYSDGLSCNLGATRALGAPLSQLEARWREDVLGQNVAGVALRNLSPFMLIMALVLIVPLWGTIDVLRQRRKRDEEYAEKPKTK
jgi:hypothetical protein